jgi:hypothetical protein
VPGLGPSGSAFGLSATVAPARGRSAGGDDVAIEHREAALTALGLDALLLGSLGVAANAYASTAADAEPARLRPTERGTPPLVSDVEAVQQLVTQLHAVVYGYPLAMGQLPVTSKEHGRAVRQLRASRVERDTQIGWLTKRSVAVPAAKPAYLPSVAPRDQKTATRLIRSMHTAFQPFCGIWVAAAGDRDREPALTLLASTTELARSWGAALPAWPGWPPP